MSFLSVLGTLQTVMSVPPVHEGGRWIGGHHFFFSVPKGSKHAGVSALKTVNDNSNPGILRDVKFLKKVSLIHDLNIMGTVSKSLSPVLNVLFTSER